MLLASTGTLEWLEQLELILSLEADVDPVDYDLEPVPPLRNRARPG